MIALLALACLATPPSVDATCAGESGTSLLVRIADQALAVGPESGAFVLVDSTSFAESAPSLDLITAYDGENADGVGVRLRLGERWVFGFGDDERVLPVPRSVRQPAHATLLGVGGATLWIAAPGIVASVATGGTAAGALEVTRIATERDMPLLLQIGDPLWVAAGAAVWQCGHGRGCIRAAGLPGRVVAVVTAPEHWWIAVEVAGELGALLHATVAEPMRVEEVMRGDVVALCADGALLRSAAGSQIVSWNGVDGSWDRSEPLVALGAALVSARRWPEASLVAAALASTVATRAPHLAALTLRCATDAAPSLRSVAAAVLPEIDLPAATAARWLLAHDSEVTVRSAALAATLAACPSPPDGRCLGLLAVHSLDGVADIAWVARDALVVVDVAAALYRASSDYKLDLLVRIAEQTDHGGPILSETLILLRRDGDGKVRALTEAVIRRRSP